MRALATCIVALCLAASPMLARAAGPDENDNRGGGGPTTQPAAGSKADPAPSASPSSAELENELREVRELLEAQTREIAEQQQRMELLEEELRAAKGAGALDPAEPSASASPVNAAVTENGGAQAENPEEPLSIHFKGITLTPGGFAAAETVWRQKALASDVNTPFNSVPYNGSSNAHISEFQASGRQSRIAMLMQGQLSSVKIGSYYEADFLSAGTTSNSNQSNSYTFRQRQFWAQAAFNSGWTFTGGQQWSLITETTHGMDNRTEALPMTIDAQYNVGFSWARQFGARLTYDISNKVWLGFAVEESQPTLTVHGNPTAQAAGTTVCVPPAAPAPLSCATTATVNLNPTYNNFLLGAFGASGGLYNPANNYGYNYAPDFVLKAVFEPGFGHYEVFGLLSSFHDRIFPCIPITGAAVPAGCPSTTSGLNASNNAAEGGGVGANARWNLFAKKVDLGAHFFGGAGIGRYGSGQLSDLTVRPNGSLVPIHNFQALGTFQLHPTAKLDIYTNVGGEFEERTAYVKSNSGVFSPCVEAKSGSGICNEGYGYEALNNSGCWTETLPVTGPATNTNLGVPTGIGGTTGFVPGPLGNCTGDTRNLIEGTLGFWYRFYKGPRGTFQYGMQYSNWVRNSWRGVGSTTIPIAASGQPHADNNMVLSSFRYYLP